MPSRRVIVAGVLAAAAAAAVQLASGQSAVADDGDGPPRWPV